MKRTFILVMAIVSIMLGGCASVQVAKEAEGTGSIRIYDKPKAEVWVAMKMAIDETGGQIVNEDEEQCTVLANYSVSLFSWGERVAIFCRPISESKTETEVISKRAVAVNITASDWTEEVYAVLERELN